jgi:membrane-bound lytic murein transglycosylase MltF
VLVLPIHAHAPVMDRKEKQQFVISQMSAKDYAKHLLRTEHKQPEREYRCLAQLWGKESAWNHRAKSPTDDYGIPQRHMSHNTAAEIADFMSHPHTQVRWGLGYIEHRYETPCKALHSWLSRADKNGRGGWY